MNIQDWFPLGWTGLISLQSKGPSKVFSSTAIWKHRFFGTQPFYCSTSHPHMTAGTTIALTRWTFVGKVISLLFNMLSSFVTAFLPRKLFFFLNFEAAVTVCSNSGAQENKICHCFHFFPYYLSWSNGTGCHDLSILNVEFQVSFSLSSFTLIKRLFSFSSLSAIRVMCVICVKVAQSRPTLCDPMDYTVHGILLARILEWVAFPSSRGSSQSRDQTQVSYIASRFFTSGATRETQEYWMG